MNELTEVFEFNGNFYRIDKDVHESRETYIDRVWHILNNLSTDNLEELIRKSRIWSNEKNLKCEYSKS